MDLEYTRNAVCPYCGNEDLSSWEINFGNCMDGETETACGSCGEEYIVTRNVEVTYSTRRAE